MDRTIEARAAAATAAALENALAALRDEIDALDDALHDLLMRRAEVVARLAASRVKEGGASPLRPGREAAILRRLLARHAGPLPPAALVRLWRELLAASSAMQGALSVLLPAGNAAMAEAARKHFGVGAVLHREPDAAALLDDLAEGAAEAAVLPLPGEDVEERWWTSLDPSRVQVVGRLPFFAANAAAARPEAMLLARGEADASGDDRGLLRLSFEADAPLPEPEDDGGPSEPLVDAIDPWPFWTRACLRGALHAAGLTARAPVLLHRRGTRAWALAELDGALAASDPRLPALRARAPALRSAEPLGFYATPIRAGDPAAAPRGE
jgi:chorismate mutase / prephenate dehydratase